MVESARMLTTARLLERNLQVAGEPHLPGRQSSSAVVSEPAAAGIWLRLRLTGCLPQGSTWQGAASQVTGRVGGRGGKC